MNKHLSLADLTMKEKVLDYLRKQLAIKIEAKKYHETVEIINTDDPDPHRDLTARKYKRLELENDIQELQRHISVIELF
ncbi:hypothetical protein [Sphingobacterium sp.]|uniref:hypothetical protein n=1 Tax=Sphingobacterium sp. TaxID=341027 RepID=UPI0028AD7B2F|nr:hypothetical protein [Sphingobacterium sp.]